MGEISLTTFLDTLKRLQPFADNIRKVDLTLVLGDDHLVTTTLQGYYDGREDSSDVLVDTTHPDFDDATGETVQIPVEATYPKGLLASLVPGTDSLCNKATLQGFVPDFDASQWDYRQFEPQKMIFLCPRTFSSSYLQQGAPVDLLPGQEVKPGDALEDMFGPAMVLVHEYFHTDYMRVDGNQSKYNPASSSTYAIASSRDANYGLQC